MRSIIPFTVLAGFITLAMYSLGWRFIDLENVPFGHRPEEFFISRDFVHYEHTPRTNQEKLVDLFRDDGSNAP